MDTTGLLNRLIEGKDLTASEANDFLGALMLGNVLPAQAGGILTALRIKGESADEILGFIEAMRSHMITVDAPGAVDIVGTGGDGSGTFNVSTASAFVVAGAGVKVAKHGNRAASSKCGSADVLEALGVQIHLNNEQAKEVFEKAGIVFMLAPVYHPALKEVVMVRKALGIRTIFNVLGPFANPASTKRQLVGVPNRDIAAKMAALAPKLGYERLLIISSDDGMDEISLDGATLAYEIKGSAAAEHYSIDPSELGFERAEKTEILGGTAPENAQIISDVLADKKGPHRDIVILNSAYALYIAGTAATPKEGVVMAEASINGGAAGHALEKLVKETNAFAVV